MWAWVLRLFGGFKFWAGNTPYERLGKILFVVIICTAVGFGFWKVFLEKKIQNIERYVNCNITQVHPVECPKEPAFQLIKLWRWRLFSVQ
jgi:hypothetical protein